jgi:hypothetical protein
VLKNHPGKPVTVFAVWEPMLPTDWSEPGPSVLMRLKDPKVRQYWDPNHSIAAILKDEHPKCCIRDGFLWDIAAAYAPGQSTLKSPFFIDGTIIRNSPALDALLAK